MAPDARTNPPQTIQAARRAVLDHMWQHCEFPASGDDPADEDRVDTLIGLVREQALRESAEVGLQLLSQSLDAMHDGPTIQRLLDARRET